MVIDQKLNNSTPKNLYWVRKTFNSINYLSIEQFYYIFFKDMKRSMTLILFLLLLSIVNADLLKATTKSPPPNPTIKTLDVK